MTSSEQLRIEPAVMASEIERLRDLEGFLKFASIPDWRRVALSWRDGGSGEAAVGPARGPTDVDGEGVQEAAVG
jgi:hypothetical protein